MKSERLQYDLILPFGIACSCSQSLRRAGLQHLSLPFDWIGRQKNEAFWEADASSRAAFIRNGFANFLDLEDFDYHGDHTNGKAKYLNRRTGFIFLHDFPAGVPIADSIAAIREKYARRISRLYQLLDASKRILLCRLDRPDLGAFTTLEECRAARRILAERCPAATIDVVLLQCDPSVPFAEHELVRVEDGVFRLAFDYRDTAPTADPKIPDLKMTAAALAAHFTVRDYRTAEEKRAHARKKQLAKWKKHGATTRLGYLWNRLLGR